MLTSLLALPGPAHAQSVSLSIQDPAISEVVFACADGVSRVPVERPGHGHVSLLRPPRACQVHLIRSLGTIAGTGRWRCTLQGCSSLDPDRQPGPGAGPLQVSVELSLAPGAGLELACPGEPPQRVQLSPPGSHDLLAELPPGPRLATLSGVPAADCSLRLWDGLPGGFHPTSWNTYYHCEVGLPPLSCDQHRVGQVP